MSSDARKRAEDALAEWRTCLSIHNDDCICGPSAMADALRALLAAGPATERETRLEAAYQREHARLTEVLGALSEVLPPGAEIRPAMLALKARAEAAEPAKGADMSRAEGALAAEVRAALNVANGRWYEWGERAESVEEILLAGLRGYERAATAEPAPPDGAEVSEAAFAQFGRALLPLWWDDGNPGDIDGSAAQDAAEASGLWRRVERHADGVECEWCNNEEPCGELTDTGLTALRGGQKGEA